MKFITLFILLATLSATACADEKEPLLSDQPDGLYTIIKTAKGTIILRLYYKETPMTVENFVGLATGRFEKTIDRKGAYYDGLTFHRVIADFMAQGGDPVGNGTGGPGYSFGDEFIPTITFDSEGLLAMANSGPSTNGSQFFITLKDTPWLNQKHTIFGKVVKNMDIVTAITQDDKITTVQIEAKGNDADTFLKSVSWESFQTKQKNREKTKQDTLKKINDSIETSIAQETPALTKNADGIYVNIKNPGTGKVLKSGQTAVVHYKLKVFGTSSIIDNSFERNEPIEVPVGQGKVIKGWELLLLQMKKNEKIRAIIPPQLAYGSSGAGGGVIPPNAFLDFEIELVDIK